MGKTLAIITARGGSKRIPGKNIKNFLGQPIINYSISAALNSGCFDEVMVSTDDTRIAVIAKKAGATIPFMRSENTSGDFATTADVILEVLDEYRKIGLTYEYCCCIYPTAIFLTAEKLITAFDKLLITNAESVIPVVRYSFPIQRSFKIENGFVRMNWPEHMNTRSQDLPPAYHDCGQFYFLRTDAFLKTKRLFTDFTIPYEMPESEVQDIDNEEDWNIAKIKYTFLLEKFKSNV
ncbi:MAG: pseudaminic acid cytidylyltransferase [Candidatus Margulisbacteria bacterium GWF2_35_9]|nr:MAG: pseudaminic acid cytidylyltransferase [Candidatus Margulisbacteria bacterium GWF2_35_9]